MKPLTDKEIQQIAEHFTADALPEGMSSEQKEEAVQYQMLMDALSEPPEFKLSHDFTDQVMASIEAREKFGFWREFGWMGLVFVLAFISCGVALYYFEAFPVKPLFQLIGQHKVMLSVKPLIQLIGQYKFVLAFVVSMGLMVQFGERIMYRLGLMKA